MALPSFSHLFGHLIIDQVDAMQTLHFFVTKGSMEQWMLYPEIKEPFTHSWSDQNGEDVDLTQVFFKPQTVSMKILFACASDYIFWSSYNQLLTILTQPGLHTIYYRETGHTYQAYYTKASSPVKYTRLKGVDEVLYGMTVTFVIPNPQDTSWTDQGTGGGA
jgi:hypothetical protein